MQPCTQIDRLRCWTACCILSLLDCCVLSRCTCPWCSSVLCTGQLLCPWTAVRCILLCVGCLLASLREPCVFLTAAARHAFTLW